MYCLQKGQLMVCSDSGKVWVIGPLGGGGLIYRNCCCVGEQHGGG